MVSYEQYVNDRIVNGPQHSTSALLMDAITICIYSLVDTYVVLGKGYTMKLLVNLFGAICKEESRDRAVGKRYKV